MTDVLKERITLTIGNALTLIDADKLNNEIAASLLGLIEADMAMCIQEINHRKQLRNKLLESYVSPFSAGQLR